MAIEQDATNDIEEIIEDEGAPAWMVTFADLMALLLVFFVLLFAMSEIEVKQFQAVMESIKEALLSEAPPLPPASEGIPTQSANITPPAPIPMQPQGANIMDDLQKIIQRKEMGEFVVVYEDGPRIIIRIEGHAIFRPGEVNMIEDVVPALDDVQKLFQKHATYSINIKGHTDNTPINTLQFPSNWELSAVRATTVLRYFVGKGIGPERLTATGYADRVPLASNDSPEGRAKNRRVEFVLEKEK